MRKLIFILIIIIASINSFSQDVVGGRIIAKQSFYLKNWADSIKTDTSYLSGNTRSLLNADAVYKFVTGRVPTGSGFGTVTLALPLLG